MEKKKGKMEKKNKMIFDDDCKAVMKCANEQSKAHGKVGEKGMTIFSASRGSYLLFTIV